MLYGSKKCRYADAVYHVILLIEAFKKSYKCGGGSGDIIFLGQKKTWQQEFIHNIFNVLHIACHLEIMFMVMNVSDAILWAIWQAILKVAGETLPN